jgi:hypothetical protein
MTDTNHYEEPKAGDKVPGMWCDHCGEHHRLFVEFVERKPNGSLKVWAECDNCSGTVMYRQGL